MKASMPLLAATILSLAACASSVRHDSPEGAPPPRLGATKVSAVEIALDENAKKVHAENLKFDPEALRAMVQRTLELKGMMSPQAGERLLIEVTDIRIRSNFSAVMFGIFAGTDSIAGNVQLRGADARPLARYAVTASYGLGGFAGGQDAARMGWLYEEFARRTVNALTGEEE